MSSNVPVEPEAFSFDTTEVCEFTVVTLSDLTNLHVFLL